LFLLANVVRQWRPAYAPVILLGALFVGCSTISDEVTDGATEHDNAWRKKSREQQAAKPNLAP
jgi:hypothetical protein